MNEDLEALEKLKKYFNNEIPLSCNQGKKLISVIEKEHKALEFIKDRFKIQLEESDLPGHYYGIMQIGISITYIKTQEEYDLLKEVLL